MKRQQAYTMVETVMVVAILGLCIGTIFSIAELSSKIWSEEKIASELREDTRIALHLFTREIRESSLATIFLGPSTASSYNAISFGQAKRNSTSGLIMLDSGNNIIWEKVIIYHTYNNPNAGTELRKSVLNWNSGLTDVQRQAQIDSYDVNSSSGREIIKNVQTGGAGLLDFSAEEYDHWTETDFFDAGIVTDRVVVSGGNVFLDGSGQTWFVGGQTGDYTPDNITISPAGASSYRILINSDSLFKSGSRVRLKFVASPSGTLNITRPSLAETDSTNNRNIVDDTRSTLTFNSSASKTLAVSESAWTDWLLWETGSRGVFSKDRSYSITYYTDTTQTGANFYARKWIDALSATQEFFLDGTDASTSPLDWGASGTAQTYLYAVEGIEVSYCSSGTLISQIYNTGVDDPVYDTLTWTETLPTGTDISIKVRSSDNADMSGATAWGSLTAFTDGSATNDISGIGTGRYVQFQAALISPSPFTQTPILSDVVLTWKGGIISITVDRYYNYRGRGYSISMTSDVKPKNR